MSQSRGDASLLVSNNASRTMYAKFLVAVIRGDKAIKVHWPSIEYQMHVLQQHTHLPVGVKNFDADEFGNETSTTVTAI